MRFRPRSSLSIALCLSVLAPVAARAGAREELIEALAAAMRRTSYRVEVASETNSSLNAQVDVQLPDRFHLRSANGEFIVHPQGTWVRQAGQWSKLPADLSQTLRGFGPPDPAQAAASIVEVEFLGEEVVAGCRSRNYRYRSKDGQFVSESAGKMLLSVCQDTGLPVRMQGRQGEDPVVLNYDFDAQLDIQPPK